MTTIGIDLGTTNSLVAFWRDGEAILIPNKLGQVITPSVVGFDSKGMIIVGEVAKQRLQTHPTHTACNFKRYMGSNKLLKVGKKEFRAEELSAWVLKSLKADAEAHLGEVITDAVISVPAYFSDAQRKATKAAGKLAGLNVQRLINEPTAAAVAYGLHEKDDDTTFLVFDIGGGTFDVSILESFEGVMQVNSSSGDNRLGGEDFVELLEQHFLQRHQLSADKLSVKEVAALHAAAENCKRTLTNNHQGEIELKTKKNNFTSEYSREDFEKICKDLLVRLRTPLERALRDASLHGDDLDAVILVGGASRMPVIRSLASKMLGQIPRSHINPDEIVAKGAAVQAGLIAQDAALKEIVLTDVCPYTLGVDVVNENSIRPNENLFHPIIDRNSPVPISRCDILYTAVDFQKVINLNIFQGESRFANENIKLGELSLEVPPSPKGEESVEVRFTYDVSGLLEVDAKISSTGLQKNIVIEGNPGMMTEKEIEKKLKEMEKIKIHPRENLDNALVIARGERLYENTIGELRDYIGNLLTRFDKIMNQQNPDELHQARKELLEIFDQIEAESPLY